jgi:uncharacterized membrane protein YhaH (DUF805 family)
MTIKEMLFSFKGRIGRASWWLWGVVIGVIYFFVSFIYTILPLAIEDTRIIAFSILFYLAFSGLTLWISLALNVKRLHDRNRSGWFLLAGLVPIIGGLWLLIEMGFLKGTDGPNRYGESPDSKAVSNWETSSNWERW